MVTTSFNTISNNTSEILTKPQVIKISVTNISDVEEGKRRITQALANELYNKGLIDYIVHPPHVGNPYEDSMSGYIKVVPLDTQHHAVTGNYKFKSKTFTVDQINKALENGYPELFI